MFPSKACVTVLMLVGIAAFVFLLQLKTSIPGALGQILTVAGAFAVLWGVILLGLFAFKKPQ